MIMAQGGGNVPPQNHSPKQLTCSGRRKPRRCPPLSEACRIGGHRGAFPVRQRPVQDSDGRRVDDVGLANG